MWLEDNEQQRLASLAIDWTNEALPNGEMTNISKELGRTTPELMIAALSTDNDDDYNSENKSVSREPLIGQLKSQLIHDQIQRARLRDYPRILHQSNTPASWYKTPVLNRSVYFYDSHNRSHIEQYQPTFLSDRPKYKGYKNPTRAKRTLGSSFQQSSFVHYTPISYSPRTRNKADFYNTAIVSHQLKPHAMEHFHPPTPNLSQRLPSSRSGLSSVPTLPPIHGFKHSIDALNTDTKANTTEIRKKLDPILMPSIS
ncbi:unnamed protein product [Adineta ricciae]|uniref:Uncharacterized protein n=1 Tax=Adineta ricciae TaxID=249248 RepID=A0A813V900_ADIRI|nr:unnamed protein product [Adineta ricciae]